MQTRLTLSKETALHVLFNNASVLTFDGPHHYCSSNLCIAASCGVLSRSLAWTDMTCNSPRMSLVRLVGFVCLLMTSPTSVAGHFYFTKLLIPALLVGRDSSPDRHARIVTTSSSTAYLYTINWESFKDGPARRKMSTRQLYSQSKFVCDDVAA